VKDNLRVTDANFEKEVLNSSIPVLVDFWASWCIPSQMMMPLIDILSNEYDGKIQIRKLNVDQNPKMRDKYKILGCPTFVLFKDGAELTRKTGAQSKNQLQKIINSVL
jgi:thioredoxin 1